MKIKDDRDEFEKRQTRLIQEIAFAMKSRLEKMGLGTDQELVESLVFDVSATLDGSTGMELDGRLVRPFLTFAEDQEGRQFVGTEGGSWMHEVCSGVVAQMFEEDSSA